MNILPIGVGGAGRRVAEKFLELADKKEVDIPTSIVVDVSKSNYSPSSRIPPEGRVVLNTEGPAQKDLNSALSSEDNSESFEEAVEKAISDDLDCFLIVGGLGGEVGANAGEVSRWLQEQYQIPVYGLGILPTISEGVQSAALAALGLSSLRKNSDGVIVWDNDAWSSSDGSIKREKVNEEIVIRTSLPFQEVNKKGQGYQSLTKEQLTNILSTEDYITIGYFDDELESQGIISELLGFSSGNDHRDQLESVTKKSALGRLSLPAELSDGEQALVIAKAPDQIISNSNLQIIETTFKDVFSPDDSSTNLNRVDSAWSRTDRSDVSVLTLVSGVKNQPRIRVLHEMAQEVEDAIEQTNSKEEIGQTSGPLTDRLQSMDEDKWDVGQLLSLSPEEFEHLVAELYRAVGDYGKVTQSTRDGGVDVMVEQNDGTDLVVQVKQYNPDNSVGKPTVQQTVGVREEHNADVAVVVTSSTFSEPALEFEKRSSDSVRLISGQELVSSLNQSRLNPSEFFK